MKRAYSFSPRSLGGLNADGDVEEEAFREVATGDEPFLVMSPRGNRGTCVCSRRHHWWLSSPVCTLAEKKKPRRAFFSWQPFQKPKARDCWAKLLVVPLNWGRLFRAEKVEALVLRVSYDCFW